MTHLLPPSKSCWHWSHFDESLPILRRGDPCALSHTHPLRAPPHSLHTNSPPESPFSGVTPTLVRLSSVSPFLALQQQCPLFWGSFQHVQLPNPTPGVGLSGGQDMSWLWVMPSRMQRGARLESGLDKSQHHCHHTDTSEQPLVCCHMGKGAGDLT